MPTYGLTGEKCMHIWEKEKIPYMIRNDSKVSEIF